MKILILGAGGMLGFTLFDLLAREYGHEVKGTARRATKLAPFLQPEQMSRVYDGIEANSMDAINRCFDDFRPSIVINCIGIIKQLPEAKDPIKSILINSLFPHQVAQACKEIGARMVQFSTDCVFDGTRGAYKESDHPDAKDLYGKTKHLGEVDLDNAVTIRSSIIGHELDSKLGLIDWFLNSQNRISGFQKVIFSGFPTSEFARILVEHVFPNTDLRGLYHVASNPIPKFDLLTLVAQEYGKQIVIEPDTTISSDRSLDATRFNRQTGFVPRSWPEMIKSMRKYYLETPAFQRRGLTTAVS